MTLSRDLVRRWMALRDSDVPASARAIARLHLADVVGAGLAAASLPQGAPYLRFARAQASARGVATLAGERLADPATAAMVDGGLIHSLEFDDTHAASIIHGGAVVAPTALALAQALGAPFERALHAYLLGYETLILLGLAAPGAFQAKGFQVTSVAGPMAAALVACELLDADEDVRVNAVGIALSQGAGVFEFLANGASVKSLHPGWAAHAGIIAARLAMAGLTGPETALEGARGLYASFAGETQAPTRLAALIEGLGKVWRIEEVAFKFLHCCHYLHPFVEAAGEIAARVAPERIDAITLSIAAGAAPVVCEPWDTKIAAKDGHAMRWSLPLVVAERLLGRDVGHAFFAAPPQADALALTRRMRWTPVEPNRFPQAFEASIACRLDDGETIERRVADVYGNPSRPAALADVLAKFRANASRALTPDRARALEQVFFAGGSGAVSAYGAALSPRSVEGVPP